MSDVPCLQGARHCTALLYGNVLPSTMQHAPAPHQRARFMHNLRPDLTRHDISRPLALVLVFVWEVVRACRVGATQGCEASL